MLDWLILLVFIVPISLFLHELGHGLLANFRKASYISIGVGVGKEIYSFRMGKIHVHISLFFFLGAFASYSSERNFTYKDIVWISLGGPTLSMAACWLSWLGWVTNHSSFLYTLMLFNGWLALINLFPYKFKGKKSDGYTLVEAILSGIFKRYI